MTIDAERGGRDLAEQPLHAWRHVGEAVGEHQERRTHRVRADAARMMASQIRLMGATARIAGGRGVSVAGRPRRFVRGLGASASAPAMPASAPKSTPRCPAPASSANSATAPPTMAATAAGRDVMAGTSSTRKTSGTAKSSGSESGTAEPMRMPMIVHTCQLAHSRTAAPK